MSISRSDITTEWEAGDTIVVTMDGDSDGADAGDSDASDGDGDGGTDGGDGGVDGGTDGGDGGVDGGTDDGADGGSA